MGEPAGTDRILTIPNLISLLRIALIPVFFALIVDHDTTQLGLVLFVVVVATDWVDGRSPVRPDRCPSSGRSSTPWLTGSRSRRG
ncbi:MAG: hypothetical protein EHM22_05910 [Actinobacteria bacterium]|nr:MAG: hypothetical protein EHM22_05910 [Actinomycetota bacterium]